MGNRRKCLTALRYVDQRAPTQWAESCRRPQLDYQLVNGIGKQLRSYGRILLDARMSTFAERKEPLFGSWRWCWIRGESLAVGNNSLN